MTIARVSDGMTWMLATRRLGSLEVALAETRERLATGKRVRTPADDPAAAGQAVRVESRLAAVARATDAVRFAEPVLEVQWDVLGEAKSRLSDAMVIAAATVTPAERAVRADEVRGLLRELTALANTDFAGRRLFGGLALDAPPPFRSPDDAGWTPATAFQGSREAFHVVVDPATGEQVRLSTAGDTIFGDAIAALSALETELRGDGAVSDETRARLRTAFAAIDAEMGSVSARRREVDGLSTRLASAGEQLRGELARLTDADIAETASELARLEAALTALVTAIGHIGRRGLGD